MILILGVPFNLTHSCTARVSECVKKKGSEFSAHQIIIIIILGAGIAQLIGCPGEKPGAILMRFESPVRLGIFLPGSTSSADSYGVRTAPRVQSHASTSERTLKIPITGSHTIVWTRENTACNE